MNIVPFWSSNLIQIYGLGNEYNVAFNLILTEVLKICTLNLNEITWILIFSLIIVFFTLKKIGFAYEFNFWETNIVIINGKEIETPNSKSLEYCNKIQCLNKYLLEEVKIKNITYVNNTNITINNIKDYKISPNINLTITRTGTPGEQVRIVTYNLWSYKEPIEKFLDGIVEKYKSSTNYEMVLIGSEANGVLSYPLPIEAINSWVSLNWKFPKLKCLKSVSQAIEPEDNKSSSDNKNKDTKEETKTINSEYTYTLDNIVNFELDDVTLSISRDNGFVYYYLKSDKICCKQWVESKISYYNQNKAKFKNKLVLSGSEITYYSSESNKKFCYVKLMWVINWYVIEKLGYQNYECIYGDVVNQFKYILDWKKTCF